MFALASLFSAKAVGVLTKLSMSSCVTCLMMHAGLDVGTDVSTKLTIRSRSMGMGALVAEAPPPSLLEFTWQYVED